MRIYTCQTQEVLEIAQKQEYFADFSRSSYQGWDFEKPYGWMMGEMDKRFSRPDRATTPVWAWFRVRGREGRPDLRWYEFRNYHQGSVMLELEVPDNEVLLFDEELWHYVLNHWYLPYGDLNTMCEDETRELEALCESDKEQRIVQSWQQIFDVVPRADRPHEFVQACFWTIKTEYIRRCCPFGWPPYKQDLAGDPIAQE